MNEEKKYRVVWVNELNEYQGGGSPIGLQSAKAAADYANTRYPNITHKIIEVKDTKPNDA